MDIKALQERLQEQANLSPEQAEQAARVALAFVAEHVPQAADLLDKAGGAEGLSKKLGGMFNR